MVHIHNGIFSSVQFSCSVVSDSLRPHESQHARPPCPSPTPEVYSNSCPLSRWWDPATSSSVSSFSSCPQSLPASGPFPMSQLFAWGSQSIGVSASASVLPMNTQNWSPLLNYKKEHTWVSSNEVDEPRAYYKEWSKSERKTRISYININMESINMVLTTIRAGKQRGHRYKEQTFGLSGRG